MAAPTFVAEGGGAVNAAGQIAPVGISNPGAGFVVVLHALVDGADNTYGAFAGTGFEDLTGTDNTMTFIGSFAVGGASEAFQRVWIGRTNGATNVIPALTPTVGSTDVYCNQYLFTDCSTGTTLATVIENGTAGATANGAGTSTSVLDTAVTTIGPDRLALNLVGINDDATGIAAFAGMSGGTWVMPATFESATGTDGTVSLMTAAPHSIGLSTGTTVVSFGISDGNRMVAQSFLATGSISGVVLRLNKGGTPTGDVVVEIQTDNAGVPSGTVIASTTIPNASIPATSRNVTYSLAATLSAATTYWIVLSSTVEHPTADVDFFDCRRHTSNAYADGIPAILTGSWAASTNDLSFGVSTPTGGPIDGGSDTITSDAWGVVGFALIGTTSAAGPVDALMTPALTAVRRASTW